MNKRIESKSQEEKIFSILRQSSEGRTITEVTEISQLPRSIVRICLARLEGAKKVNYRPIGMSKLYFLLKKGK